MPPLYQGVGYARLGITEVTAPYSLVVTAVLNAM